MANKILRKVPEADKIYTPQLIKKAQGKPCGICNGYISEAEAESKDFCYSKTKRGNEVFVHMRCWSKTYQA